MIYPKAIYMVEGEPFEVQELHYREDEEKVAYVKRVQVDYFTDAISAKGVWVLQRFTRREAPGWGSEQGEVLVAEKVVGFKKIKMGTLENVGSGEVELPQQEMQTTSAWLTFDPALLAAISSSREELVDGLRALTYLLHHLAPIFLLCDVRDVGAWLGDGSPAEEGVVVTRETQRDAAPRRGALHADPLPLRQPARRHRARRAHLRGAARAPRPGAGPPSRPAPAGRAVRPAWAR